MHSIHDRHGIELPIKRDWKRLRTKFSSIVKSNYSLTTVKYPLPKPLFGERLKGGYLRPAIGLQFNIKELLAEALLECNPELFLKGSNPDSEYGQMNGLIDAPLCRRICKDANGRRGCRASNYHLPWRQLEEDDVWTGRFHCIS